MRITAAEYAERYPEGRLSMREFHARVASFGYRIWDVCRSDSKILRTGEVFPCATLGYEHIETGLTFCNVNAPRDENYRRLLDLRKNHYFIYHKRVHS